MDPKPKSQQRYADPQTNDTAPPERRNHPQQEQTNHKVWVELVIADRPMEFSVPRSKRNPPVDFVIAKQQRNEDYAYSVCFWNRRSLLGLHRAYHAGRTLAGEDRHQQTSAKNLTIQNNWER